MRYQEPSPSVDHSSHPQMNTYIYYHTIDTGIIRCRSAKAKEAGGGGQNVPTRWNTHQDTQHQSWAGSGGRAAQITRIWSSAPPRVRGSQNGRGGGHVWSRVISLLTLIHSCDSADVPAVHILIEGSRVIESWARWASAEVGGRWW